VAALRAAGSTIGDAVPGERVRPDGGVVRWHVATASPLAADRPPFLIKHELAGPEWGEAARRARAAFVHPLGGQARVVGLELAVASPAEVAADFARTVGVAFGPAPGAQPGELEARVGDHSIRLVASRTGDRSEAGPGPGRESALQRGSVPPSTTPGGPLARVGLLATAGDHLLVDLWGVRFARL
jgi:hypothetical protein